MELLSLSVGSEFARVKDQTIPLFRGMVTTPLGEVVDRTKLFDTHEEALREAGVLLTLYKEEQLPREKRIGYVSPAAVEEMMAYDYSCTIKKEPTGAFVMPVYIKVNDAFVTQKNGG